MATEKGTETPMAKRLGIDSVSAEVEQQKSYTIGNS